jgi:hypothetical protein
MQSPRHQKERKMLHTHTHTHTHTRTKPVCEQVDITVLCNQGLHTDRDVTANRPYVAIKNKEEKTCILIDVAVPADRNVM